MDIVELLDSDEEESKTEKSTQNAKPSNIQPQTLTASTKLIPKNRPGPLSMKIKCGVPIDKDDLARKIPEKTESPTPDNDIESRKQKKIITNLLDPNSKFLADFDPERSIRERRKIHRKTTGSQPPSYTKPGTLYDEHGVHRDSGLDVCDCLDVNCAGCHFPCPVCSSGKCGQVCRVHRKFIYDSYLVDGKDTEIKSPFTNRR